jgi:GNAT superfamily N-acetyltransferase
MTLTLNRENIENYPELLDIFLKIVQNDASFLRSSYPNFDSWLTTKVLPGIATGERTVIVEQRHGRPVGLLILKHTKDERKLCTLRVRPEFEFQGIGVRLFNKAFEILETSRPLLSVSELALPKFSKIFDHFGFSFEKSYQGLYLPKTKELSYNGALTNEPIFFDFNHAIGEKSSLD